MPGMMTMETGSLALHQELGRWHFSAMGIANKYWMPWQYRIATQYGVGGTIGYDLSESVTLHAFGYYYANQMQVGPAMSPYINNTTYGGYADVRFSDTLLVWGDRDNPLNFQARPMSPPASAPRPVMRP